MRYLFTILLSFLLGITALHAQTYNWIRHGGSNMDGAGASGADNEKIMNMCTDPNGNVYILSTVGLMGSCFVDGTVVTSGYGGISEFHVLFASYTCNGILRFTKYINGSNIYAQGLTADSAGHVYLALCCSYTTASAYTFRLDADTTITGAGSFKETIIQYDTSGNFNWLRFAGINPAVGAMGGKGYHHLTLDGAGYPHFIVPAKSGVVFRPGDTSRYGFTDLKYDVSGNLHTVKHIGLDSTFVINVVSIEKSTGKLFVTGSRARNFIDPPFDSSDHNFIAAFDTNRVLLWKDSIAHPASSTEFTGLIQGVKADNLGHLYVNFGVPGIAVYRGDTVKNSFMITIPYQVSAVMKLDTLGNVIWIRKYSFNYNGNIANDLVLMPNNKLAICGGLIGGQLVGGFDTVNIYPGEGHNPIFSILDSAGYVHTVQQIHGAGFYDFAYRIASDKVGNLYVGCQMQTNAWAGSLPVCLSSGGYSDYFLVKYGVNCSCTSMPTANYTYTGTDLTRSFTYTGTTVGIDSVKWTFGDGGTSTSMTPMHTYTGAGTFTTCVRVYSACGNDMRCHEITVTCVSLPVSAFTDTGNYVHGFAYTGTTTGLDSVKWDFGDGTFGTGLTPTHTYAIADTYHVCARVYTNCGKDTFCYDIIVLDTTTTLSTTLQSSLNVNVYPNPTTGELYVTNFSQQGKYRLLNIVGVALMEGDLQSGNNTLSIRQMPPGIYVLEMMGSDGMRNVVRVVKQ